MKFVTREHARIDRIACPWLIRRFIDPDAEIAWVPANEVGSAAAASGATPFDVPGVALGHHGEQCSFDAFIRAYQLDGDGALAALARIVRAADTDRLDIAPEAAGLLAIAGGYWAMAITDEQRLALQSPMYDALYVYCGGTPRT